MSVLTRATIADLYRVPEHGKAELVNGELIRFMPTGGIPSRASRRICRSLEDYEDQHGGGYAIADNAGFVVDLPHRESFSPDAAWYTGRLTMDFCDGPPLFAAEIRGKDDYGPQVESERAAKRRDYFAAGALVVWDVDLLSDDVVKVYRHDSPDFPDVYRRGAIAAAEPAVPGWQMPVDELFA